MMHWWLWGLIGVNSINCVFLQYLIGKNRKSISRAQAAERKFNFLSGLLFKVHGEKLIIINFK